MRVRRAALEARIPREENHENRIQACRVRARAGARAVWGRARARWLGRDPPGRYEWPQDADVVAARPGQAPECAVGSKMSALQMEDNTSGNPVVIGDQEKIEDQQWYDPIVVQYIWIHDHDEGGMDREERREAPLLPLPSLT